MADDRRPAHDRFERRRKREAQGLQPDGNQVIGLVRDKELHARDLLGICRWLNLKATGPDRVVVDVVMVAIVIVGFVTGQVGMHPVRTVMAVVMVIRVGMHQRRAQRANWNRYGERDGEEPATH